MSVWRAQAYLYLALRFFFQIEDGKIRAFEGTAKQTLPELRVFLF